MCETKDFSKCKANCPECGLLCNCYHADVGVNRWYDRYALYCPVCQKTFYEEVDGGEPEQPSELEKTFCPFCHVDCHKHRPITRSAQSALYAKKELHGSIASDEPGALPCPKCSSSVRCAYQGDCGAVDYSWTWFHKCTNTGCDYEEYFSKCACAGQELGPDDSGCCPNCGNLGEKRSETA